MNNAVKESMPAVARADSFKAITAERGRIRAADFSRPKGRRTPSERFRPPRPPSSASSAYTGMGIASSFNQYFINVSPHLLRLPGVISTPSLAP